MFSSNSRLNRPLAICEGSIQDVFVWLGCCHFQRIGSSVLKQCSLVVALEVPDRSLVQKEHIKGLESEALWSQLPREAAPWCMSQAGWRSLRRKSASHLGLAAAVYAPSLSAQSGCAMSLGSIYSGRLEWAPCTRTMQYLWASWVSSSKLQSNCGIWQCQI